MISKRQRTLSFVPKKVILILIFSLILQCLWHYSFSNLKTQRDKLPSAPHSSIIRFVSLDDAVTAAKLVMLWLQAFDNQPGISIPLKELDYDMVIEWMDLIMELDNKIKYPLLSAIRFYAEVADEQRKRKMVDYVSKKFMERPNERWFAMTHAVFVAKHRIKDLELAAETARLLRLNATADSVPHWAKQMEFFVLEDMGELESAKVLIGGLLESGELDDPAQRTFLMQRLKEIETRQTQDMDKIH